MNKWNAREFVLRHGCRVAELRIVAADLGAGVAAAGRGVDAAILEFRSRIERASAYAAGAAEARLTCWKHLEACACYGSGIESGAVRALLMLLEQTDAPDAARLADFVRLVLVCRPEPGAVTALLERAFPELLASAESERHAAAS